MKHMSAAKTGTRVEKCTVLNHGYSEVQLPKWKKWIANILWIPITKEVSVVVTMRLSDESYCKRDVVVDEYHQKWLLTAADHCNVIACSIKNGGEIVFIPAIVALVSRAYPER